MKRNNHIFPSFCLALAVIFQPGCVKNLLDHEPTTEISTNTFWQTVQDAEQGVNAVYNSIKNTFEVFYTFDCYPYGDLLYNVNLPTNLTGTYWNNCYDGLNRANNAIANLRRMQSEAGDDTAKKQLLERYEGEARFIRAFYYFFMIDVWGDVQYLDHVPTQAETYTIPRTPIAEVRDHIFDDLDFAASVLPAAYTANEDLGRATRIAALGYKGKLELYWACWKKNGRPEIDGFTVDESEAREYYLRAIENFKEVMDPKYGLELFGGGAAGEYINPLYLQLFDIANEKCSEVIFAMQYGGPSIGQGEELIKFFGNRSVLNGWANMQPTNRMIDLYQLTSTGDYAPPVILSSNMNLPGGASNPATYAGRDYRMRGSVVWNGEKMRTISVDGMVLGDSMAFQFGNKNGYLDYNDSKSGYMFRKFVRQYAGYSRSNGPQDFYLMRLPDIWTMYCEAMNEVYGPSEELFLLLDRIRSRGNLPPLDRSAFNDRDKFFEAIKQERAVEFIAEGHRFFDIRRWRLAEEIWDYPNGTQLYSTHNEFIQDQFRNANDKTMPRYYIYAIPEDERLKNPNLTQNTPWL